MTAPEIIRIATRASPQAWAQAMAVATALQAQGRHAELVAVETTGDRQADMPLHVIGGQGVFVKEIQRAVLDGRCDLAVHSAKDLPSTPQPGLRIGAFMERRSAADALIGCRLDELAPGSTVATGSVRRRAQLARVRPDLQFVELRGNIAARLAKVPAHGAIVMAVAALEILEATHHIAEVLDWRTHVPAVGQGCVAVEARDDAADLLELLAAVEDPHTRAAVEVERAFLAELGSGCSLPVGAHCTEGRLHTFLASGGPVGAPPVGHDCVPSAALRVAGEVVELTGDHRHNLELARRAAADAHRAVTSLGS